MWDPAVEELVCPGWVDILPERMEVFLQDEGPDSLQVVGQQFPQPNLSLGRKVFRSFEKDPFGATEEGLFSLRFQGPDFLAPDLVDGLRDVGHDVKAIQDVQGLRSPLGNDF